VCAKLGPNCASLHTNGSCQRCVLGYQISGNGSCILTIPNCKQYNFTGCNLCERTFTLSPSGTCSKMIQGCANMTDDGRCRACGPAFTMQLNNSTTPPSTICVRSVDNCLIYTSQGCLNCKVGFKMVNGACASIVAYCTQYDPNNECTFCDMGYYLSRGLCIPLPSNCLSVDNGYLCTTCKGGFVLLRGACFPENTLCL
jgi:proprotein convertase subtilisin/kexin type 5